MSSPSPSLRVPEQQNIPLPLPIVKGHQDYAYYKSLIARMDEVLCRSGLEEAMQEQALEKAQAKRGRLSHKARLRIQRKTSVALRCNVARLLSGQSYRDFSVQLCESVLLQRFCRLGGMDEVRAPSKSTLQSYAHMFEEGQLRSALSVLFKAAEGKPRELGLQEGLELSKVYVDSTCVELNVHYPVDWVLLRDGVRTLSKSIECIRRHGLKHRICKPSKFRTQMNQCSIEMSQASRRGGSKSKREAIFRKMKKLCAKVAKHAKRYRDMLASDWAQTDLSQGQAAHIVRRMDAVLQQLPQAVKQAHARIITETKVSNKDKILSLYQPQTQVYPRGKAAKRTEFGLQLLLAESPEGLLLDWHLEPGAPKNDTQHLQGCLARLQEAGLNIQEVTSDRGFASATNRKHLQKHHIVDHTCPRSPEALNDKLQDEAFVQAQRRRAQTEGRIGIVKHQFLGAPMLCKGQALQRKHVALSVLAHNVWKIAKKGLEQTRDVALPKSA